MKNKFLAPLLSLVSVFVCAFSLAACGDSGNSNDNGGSNTHTSHNWSSTYTKDGDRHYQTCDGCDEKNYSDHVYVDGVCVCGDVDSNDLLFQLNTDGESYCVTGIADDTATEVEIPEIYNGKRVTSIGESAFRGCSRLTRVTIGKNVTSIGSSAFYNCTSLTGINIPNGVITIGSSAFSFCSSLASITLPDSVISVGSSAFNYCSSLASIYYTGDIGSWCGISGWDSLVLSKVYIGNQKLQEMTSITIPYGVTLIGDGAFSGCSNLTSITIPDSVTDIGSYAFSLCSNLTSITFNGRIEQWNAIVKGSYWDFGIGDYTIHCTQDD